MKRSLKKTLSLAFFILVMDFIFIYVLKHNSLGDGGLFINQGLNLKNSALAVSYNRCLLYTYPSPRDRNRSLIQNYD